MTVRGANFSLNKNEKILFLASNGMGKTTMLKVLSGFDDSYLGSISLNGKELKDIDDGEKNFSLLLDEPVFFKNKSIKFNFDFLCEILGKDKFDDDSLSNILAQIGVERKVSEKISKLSLFEKRKLAVLRSKIKSPTILFLDDQFNDLEEKESLGMEDVYKNLLNETGTGIFAISDETFKRYREIFDNAKFSKVLYLCDAELFEFKSIAEFEKLLLRKNVFEFVEGFYSLECLIFRSEDCYTFCQEDVREIEIEKSLNAKLDELKLEIGETEKICLKSKQEINFDSVDEHEFNEMLKSGRVLVYLMLDGKKLF